MSIPSEQQDVTEFLSGLAGGPPRETHISAVFIGHDTVWKLKKSIKMPFLDFRTRASRAHFLQRELELNSQAAPGIYRDVAGIERQPDGTLGFGEGDPIDYVLRMARVPDQDFLDVIADEGRLTSVLLDALGDVVAAYHAARPSLFGRDNVELMRRITEGNTHSALQARLPSDDVLAWKRKMMALIDARRSGLAARSCHGFVRRCHGDLHLGNLCLWDGKPVPFDALEFDEDLATIDVSYDLAFLLMDLNYRVGRAAANRVMNRYVARTGDAGLVGGLALFLSQRAMVRAHVLAATGKDGSAYLAAAVAYLAPADPLTVAIGGLQGTGKSTLARALAPELGSAPGALVLRSDETRKRLWGVAPEAHLPAEAYAPAANTATNDALVQQARIAAEAGHSVVIDATFLDVAVRREIVPAARPFLGIWLQAPLALLEQRVAARTGDASDATVAVLRRSAQDDPGAGGWLAVDATDAAQALVTVRQAVVDALAETPLRTSSAPDPGP
jgi:aminoglycoside phosphotransferase family enzyme/predicted kinase